MTLVPTQETIVSGMHKMLPVKIFRDGTYYDSVKHSAGN